MGNPVMHFQICGEDVDAMSAFYREVFGWRIEPRRLTSVDADVSGTHPTIEAEEGSIAGGIIDRIPAKGGKELAGGDGAGVSFDWQEFKDPEGNLVGLIQR